ncbi:hypothetical protein GCM10017673_30860 [Streptosporangium violaceochromogenes]|nr:hypothetical protein GCM10017673_30860 [Streptosporangium violaceochromogenes]
MDSGGAGRDATRDVVRDAMRDPVERASGGRRGWTATGAALLVAMTAAQVVSGVRPQPGGLTGVIVLLLAGGALAFASGTHGPRRAVAAFAAAVTAGYAAEWVGVRTGLPFGEYDYTGALWPQVGGVPVIVALAWGGMGLAAHATAAAILSGRAAAPDGSASPGSPATPGHSPVPGSPAAPGGRLGRVVVGAGALTAWDLFLDPQMTRLGLWSWAEPGLYRGIPAGNFAGWLLVSLLVMALIDVIVVCPAARSTGLVSVYTVMAVMETVGFAAVFDPPDPLVAVAGGLGMGLFAVPAWRPWERWGRRRPDESRAPLRSREPRRPGQGRERGRRGAWPR